MRLGKTLVAIRAAELRSPGGIRLVIAPLSVLRVWEKELRLDNLRSLILHGPESTWEPQFEAALKSGNIRWFLINYDRIRISTWVCDEKWDTVILDESTRIRNPKAKRTHIIAHRFDHVEHKMILSGLPNPEGPLDFFMQFRFLNGPEGWMGCTNYWQFRNRYFNQVWHNWYPRKGVAQSIRDYLRKQCFQMSKQQAGLFAQEVKEVRYIDLPPAIMSKYRIAERDWVLGKRETEWRPVVYNWLLKLSGGLADEKYRHRQKIDEVIDLLTNDLADEQVVIAFRFNEELHTIGRELDKHKITHTAIYGEIPEKEREARRLSFQKGKARVCLLQAAIREGIDLSAADTMIHFSLYPDGEILPQLKERIYNPDKKRAMLHVHIVAKGTVDEDVYQSLIEKRAESKSYEIDSKKLRKELIRGINKRWRKAA